MPLGTPTAWLRFRAGQAYAGDSTGPIQAVMQQHHIQGLGQRAHWLSSAEGRRAAQADRSAKRFTQAELSLPSSKHRRQTVLHQMLAKQRCRLFFNQLCCGLLAASPRRRVPTRAVLSQQVHQVSLYGAGPVVNQHRSLHGRLVGFPQPRCACTIKAYSFQGDFRHARIHSIPAFSDNYIWLILDTSATAPRWLTWRCRAA